MTSQKNDKFNCYLSEKNTHESFKITVVNFLFDCCCLFKFVDTRCICVCLVIKERNPLGMFLYATHYFKGYWKMSTNMLVRMQNTQTHTHTSTNEIHTDMFESHTNNTKNVLLVCFACLDIFTHDALI